MAEKTDVSETQLVAILILARKLFEYGQYTRVLSILDFADWLDSELPDISELRFQVFCKLGRWEEAVALSRKQDLDIPSSLMAVALWNAGQLETGDRRFLKPQ